MFCCMWAWCSFFSWLFLYWYYISTRVICQYHIINLNYNSRSYTITRIVRYTIYFVWFLNAASNDLLSNSILMVQISMSAPFLRFLQQHKTNKSTLSNFAPCIYFLNIWCIEASNIVSFSIHGSYRYLVRYSDSAWYKPMLERLDMIFIYCVSPRPN